MVLVNGFSVLACVGCCKSSVGVDGKEEPPACDPAQPQAQAAGSRDGGCKKAKRKHLQLYCWMGEVEVTSYK